MTFGWETATVLAGGVCTLAIFSFVVRENPFYRFFEHLFIGIAAGWGVVLTIQTFLWPRILVPLFGLDLVRYPDGSMSGGYNRWMLLYIVPMIFGLFYYFIYSARYNWIAKLVIGFSLGAGGGLAFEGFFNQMLPQLKSSFKPLVVLDGNALDWSQSINNIVFVLTLLAVMYDFFFSFRRSSPLLQKVADSGRWLMMVCFGAYFGSTVMARMALLVERLQFLLSTWREALAGLIFS